MNIEYIFKILFIIAIFFMLFFAIHDEINESY